MAKVYCTAKDDTHEFYLNANGCDYYLFSQNRRKSVDSFYRHGVYLEKAINHGIGRSDWAIHHTMDKLMNYIPYIVNLLSSLFVFISVIFFTTKLADNSEIIAMRSNGMSFNRLLKPYMLSAALISLASFILGSYIIPQCNERRIDFENTYLKAFAAEDKSVYVI